MFEYTPKTVKESFVQTLVEEHTKIVCRALDCNDGTRVIPDSVFKYTEMFMDKVRHIVGEMK